MKRLRSDLNETASNDAAASTATTTAKDSTNKGVTKGVPKSTANLEGLLGVSGATAVAASSSVGGGATSPATAVTDAPAVAPKSVTGSSADSTTGLFGEMSVSAGEGSADGTAAPDGASPNSPGGGGGGRRSDGGMVSEPPAKRHRSTAAAAVEGVGWSIGDSVGAEGVGGMGETELREQLARQNRLLAEMAKELEGLRRERGRGAVGNGGGSVGGVGEGSAVLPVRSGGTCVGGGSRNGYALDRKAYVTFFVVLPPNIVLGISRAL